MADNKENQVNELIAQVTDEIRLDKLTRESEQRQLDALQQRLDALRGVQPLPTTTLSLESDDEEAEIALILEQIADEQRLENLNEIDKPYAGNINLSELIDETHHQRTLSELSEDNTPLPTESELNKANNQGFFGALQQFFKTIPLFKTMMNFFMPSDKHAVAINIPSKPVSRETRATPISQTVKTKSSPEPQPKDWHQPSSSRQQENVTPLNSKNSYEKNIFRLQKQLKEKIVTRNQALKERYEESSEKQSTNHNRPK